MQIPTTMKKLLSLIVMLLLSEIVPAQQKSVTKFLGIPVDGYKSDMIGKLKEKGYAYDSAYDCLKGEFNGRDVHIYVVTNNNKVYRIMVADAVPSNESDIKIRFNNLCQQFSENDRYFSLDKYTLSEDEDISYEMTVHNKRYQATYYQLETNDADTEQNLDEQDSFIADMMNRSVWFMINERYGRYYIVMYYDNVCNQANGEDL